MLKLLFILMLFVLPCQAQNESWSTARWNRWVREMIITNSPAVSWTNMANIPAGFADGVDNTGGVGGGIEQTNISYTAVTNAPWQWGSANLSNWSALATSAKQDASANLTTWSGVTLFDTNGVTTAFNAADTVVSNGLSARLIATNTALATRITDATNDLFSVVVAETSGVASNLTVEGIELAVGAAALGSGRTYLHTSGSAQFGAGAFTIDSTGNATGNSFSGDLSGTDITAGTVADARIAATLARDAEVAAAYQPLDADLTDVADGTISPGLLGSGSALQVVRRNAANTALEFATLSAGGHITKLEMTTNFVNAHGVANTLTNIPQLSFSAVSGTTYKFRAVIYFTTAATTTGSRWCLTGPAMTAFGICSEYTLTATTTTRNAMLQATSLPAAANLTSAAGVNMALLEGIFRPSANGTVSVAFASEVLSSAVTAQTGSTLEYW